MLVGILEHCLKAFIEIRILTRKLLSFSLSDLLCVVLGLRGEMCSASTFCPLIPPNIVPHPPWWHKKSPTRQAGIILLNDFFMIIWLGKFARQTWRFHWNRRIGCCQSECQYQGCPLARPNLVQPPPPRRHKEGVSGCGTNVNSPLALVLISDSTFYCSTFFASFLLLFIFILFLCVELFCDLPPFLQNDYRNVLANRSFCVHCSSLPERT